MCEHDWSATCPEKWEAVGNVHRGSQEFCAAGMAYTGLRAQKCRKRVFFEAVAFLDRDALVGPCTADVYDFSSSSLLAKKRWSKRRVA